MRLAILHYHLDPSGLTRVIENQLRALNQTATSIEPFPVLILTGPRRSGWNPDLTKRLEYLQVDLHAVAGLDHDARQVPSTIEMRQQAEQILARELEQVLRRYHFAPDNSILHVHNHSLGKNVAMPGALRLLAAQGWRLLLQIHEFAEDYRPVNYLRLTRSYQSVPARELAELVYPVARNIHYAVLNGRDQQLLLQAGLPPEQLHLLPYPVPTLEPLTDRESARRALDERLNVPQTARFLLYPVRGIRRRNLGEALLWTLLAPAPTFLGVTQPAVSESEVPLYEQWKRFAAEHDFAARWETGGRGGVTFPENLAAADAILSTSVAEGFCLIFLEAWMAQRPLVGRDLPDLTADLRSAGIQLAGLRDHLAIPWPVMEQLVPRREVFDRWRAKYETLCLACGRSLLDDQDWQVALAQREQLDYVDFADLEEGLQQSLLVQLQRDAGRLAEVRAANNWIEAVLQPDPSVLAADIAHNQTRIEAEFGLNASGRRLRHLYQHVLASSVDDTIGGLPEGDRILETFLHFQRLRPIRL